MQIREPLFSLNEPNWYLIYLDKCLPVFINVQAISPGLYISCSVLAKDLHDLFSPWDHPNLFT